jgi:ribose transport system permease protein
MSAFFTAQAPNFMTYGNWVNIFTALSVVGIIAVPATLLLGAGQLDLSVGSAAALVGIALGVVAQDAGIGVGVVAAIVVGIGLGVVNGILVAGIGISSLIATLATLAAYRGLARVLSDGQTVLLPAFRELGTSRVVFDIPLPVLLFAGIALLFALLARYTVFGRSLYAIGANREAARLAGIRAERHIFQMYLLSAGCVTLAGLILVSQLGAASPNAAFGLELSVVTAVVLGGTSLSGGRGAVLGTVLGLLVIGVLNNGMILMNISNFWQEVARGALLAAAVSIDVIRRRLRP